MLDSQTVAALSLRDCCEDREKAFWQLWEQYKNYLARCCLKWMNNSTDAEDALSRAMLKAWEKIRDCTVEIKNIKAWLTQLTHNLCVDIHRECHQGTRQVETLEFYEELVSKEETPVLAATQQELQNFFCLAIDKLPPKLQKTFILHFEEELSYKEIAEKLNISYDNVRKRISQARAILRERFNQDFVGEDRKSNVETFHETSLHPTIVSQTPEEFEGVDLEKNQNLYVHQIFVDEELQAAMPSIAEIEAVVVDAQSDGEKIAEIQDISQSISEKLNFILPWRSKIAVTHTKPAYSGFFNEAHLRRLIDYFVLRWKLWADSRAWVALANINNKIDSS